MLKDKLTEMRSVVTGKRADLILVDDIPKPCNNEVNWSIIYRTGNYAICSTTAAISKEDRRPLTELYKSLVANGVRYFDVHDALCEQGKCGIYDRESGSLIYSENSPHFPASRPSPLESEWFLFFSSLPPVLATSETH